VKGKRGMIERWRPAVRIHDLRHTFASYLVSKGQSLHIVGRLLGHVRSETTQRYSHIQDEALRDAADVFSGIFEAARSGERKQTT
jgi:site-specific recombinase XerD